jgi:hypothetical protein
MKTSDQIFIIGITVGLLLLMFILYWLPAAGMFMIISGIVPLLIGLLTYRLLRSSAGEESSDRYKLP